ncbi:DUF4097 family beta strand repeat-containing protein [Agaribacter flavus]|uniref:DUF4097 domain-containing protein n=1 Tax=Agaribacter flavus TaxID=1902781 RepID=A0ABV7FPU2_9ALTE
MRYLHFLFSPFGNNKRKLVLGSLVLLSVNQAWAGKKIDEIKDASPDSIVKIEHLSGEATIEGWDKNQVKVSGELGENTKDFQFTRDGKTISIIVKVEKKNKKHWNYGHYEGDDLTIFVPKKSRVHYRTTNADVGVSGILGGTNIDVINGNIRASELEGRIYLETVNGEVSATKLSGDLVVDTVNGDIDIEHIAGKKIRVEAVNGDIQFDTSAADVNVETVNGDMQLIVNSAMDINMNTVNGSVDARLTLGDGAYVQASSVGGSIDLSFDENIQASFDIESHAGGRIRNRLNDIEPQKAKYGPRRWLEFSIGEPTATVEVSTVNGRVTIEKK